MVLGLLAANGPLSAGAQSPAIHRHTTLGTFPRALVRIKQWTTYVQQNQRD